MTHITINDQTPRIAYTVGGSATQIFTVPFEFFSTADLKVYVGGVLATLSASPTLTTEYSVAGTLVDGGYEGGTITLGAAVSNTTVIVSRDTPISRTTDFPYPSPNLNIKELNTQLDILFAIMQQISLQYDRSLHLDDSDSTTAVLLPSVAIRANQLLGFDAVGAPAVAAPTNAVVSVAMQPVVNAATLANALAQLGAANLTAANTFTADQTIRSTDASAGVGPLLDLDRNSASPAVSDALGFIRFLGRSSTAVQREYVGLLAIIIDPVNATEDGILQIRTSVAGTATARLSIGAGDYSANATGGDKGVDSANRVSYYRQGALIDVYPISTQANGYTQVAGDEFKTLVASSGGAVGWTMLSGATFGAGHIQRVSCDVAGTVLTLTRAGSDTFASGGVTNLTTLKLTNGDRGYLVCDGGSPAIWRFFGTRHFESAQQTITSGGALTLAHGLGVQPREVIVYAHCTTAELNYSIGDETIVAMGNVGAGTNAAVTPDATNLNIRYGSAAGTFGVINKTTGASASITNANWTAIWWAAVYN